jgi:hypothetical protein
MESLLVTPNDLKQFTTISSNIDTDMLFPFLLVSQQTLVAPVLGTALYDDIINRFDTNTLSGDTKTLYEKYLIPAVGWGSYYLALPFLAYKTNRNGVNTSGTDTLTPVVIEEMNVLTNRLNTLKDFYLSQLEEYLVDNASLFPLFRRNNVREGTGSSIYLGYRTRRARNEYWDLDRLSSLVDDSDGCC